MTGVSRLMLGPLVALAVGAVPAGPQTAAIFPPLAANTTADWNRYVAAVGDRVDRELKSSPRFLALDFGNSAAADRKSVLGGSISIAEMTAHNAKGGQLDVNDGWVHHWRGAILLRGAKLNSLFKRLQMEVPGAGKGDVLEGSIIARRQEESWMKTSVKIRRTHYVTVFYNTEHEVVFKRWDSSHRSSRSFATKIAQVYDAGTRTPREAVDQGDGYLLRWNSYWRYEETPEGVIAECESVSLSTVPFLLFRPVAGKIASDAAREAMTRALQNLKDFAATRPGTRPALSPVR